MNPASDSHSASTIVDRAPQATPAPQPEIEELEPEPAAKKKSPAQPPPNPHAATRTFVAQKRRRKEPEQKPAFDKILRRSPPDYVARARVLRDMLSDLGVSGGDLPDDGEKQRKAARVGAKRRIAVLDKEHPELDLDDTESEAQALLRELFEYGPLTDAMSDPSVREVVVRGPHQVWVVREDGRERLPAGFSGPDAVGLLVRRLADARVRWDETHPWLDLYLADGSHIRGAHASVAPGGPVVVIERPAPTRGEGLVELVAEGVLPPALAELLVALFRGRGSLLLCLGEGTDGAPLLSALGHELGNIAAERLALVRTGGRVAPPNGALVFDAEPGLTGASISLAVDAGATRLMVHRGGGSGLASIWSGLERGLAQVVLSLRSPTPEEALSTCVEGLVLGGFGRERNTLASRVGDTFDLALTLAPRSDGGEAVVTVSEFDRRGQTRQLLSRSSPEGVWHHHGDPSCVAALARRGVPFDPARLAALGQ
ncbi:type II/IV secretion system protein [Plesiocystis pacifica SIR-1]|uniref:Type II/IV secretion system protein n=1 Tax=Plesiocystis pacifica SIR-1 TaxID=391625 RepID=A6G7Y3_9BACT|nr:Flp pilus assembly complex ATPase component TadA [Plesiocystis pacifica]EDM78076.1 type II/IV secretion system protein [Plesiocystis pacifica SIR-1]